MKKTRIAIVYDFDRTLSKSEMQDGFIRSLGMEPKQFWKEAGEYAEKNQMDKSLAYLYLMVSKSKDLHIPIDRSKLVQFGKNIQFYKGVNEWFQEISEVGKKNDVIVEHYLISAGLKEIIEGTSISKQFEKIYASEYYYDENGNPVWLKNVVNFTTKTQFLFRINKGEFDIWDDKGVNEYRIHDERPYPFQNMIYIGDGTTDIPCMKLVKMNGGHSIGVYANNKAEVNKLMYDERINFACWADYTKGKDLFNVVSEIIGEISHGDKLRRREYRDYKEAENAVNETITGEERIEETPLG